MSKYAEWDRWIGSTRLITSITPDTFLKKIHVVSTVVSNSGGETAVRNMRALNHFDPALFTGSEWKVLKKHRTFKEAKAWHDKYCAEFYLHPRFVEDA